MEYNFKYLKSNLHIIAGAVWYFTSAISMGLIVFFLVNMRVSPFSLIIGPILLTNLILDVLLGNYYTTLQKRDYICVNSDIMLIDNGLIRKRKKICLENIKSIKEIGNKLRVGLNSGKDISIHLELLSLQDITKLINILEDK